jgi:Fe-S oxidoreductase
MGALNYADALREQGRDIADACVKCGKCFEACPMTSPGGLNGENPKAVMEGIVEILRGQAGSAAAQRWTEVCTHSGTCIPACDYGINPRLMMSIAGLAVQSSTDEHARRQAGLTAFNGMARNNRVITRLQLDPDQLSRVSPAPGASRQGGKRPDLLFYTGCNVLRTPHIALLCLDVLDALEVSYAVMGGPSHCCGVHQFEAGDAESSGRFAYATVDKLAGAGARTVVSWCPNCQIQIGEIALPAYARSHGAAPMSIAPFVEYLASRIDDLRPHLRHRVEKRVALNERPTFPGVNAGVRTLLSAIPGVELVEIDVPRVGAMSNSLTVLPKFKEELRQREFAAAAAAGVTTLATVYHACHREICQFENDVSFEIINFMELIGESMGIHEADLYKRLKIAHDVDVIMAETDANIRSHGLDGEAVRAALVREFWST